MSMPEDQPGRFLSSAVCSCGEDGCAKETFVQFTQALKRVGNSPDDDVPGDYVAFVVKDMFFPDGWSLGRDLKPRCPDHGSTENRDEQG